MTRQPVLRTSLKPGTFVLGGGLALILSACGPVVPRVTPELVVIARERDQQADQPRLEAGRDFYVNRCGSCHSLYDPREYDEREWPRWVRKMSAKSHLKPGQDDLIIIYLLTSRTALEREAQATGSTTH